MSDQTAQASPVGDDVPGLVPSEPSPECAPRYPRGHHPNSRKQLWKGDPVGHEFLNPRNGGVHWAHTWADHGAVRDVAWPHGFLEAVSAREQELVARCGGLERMPAEARTALEHWRSAYGGRLLLQGHVRPRHFQPRKDGTLPRAVADDLGKFEAREARALERLAQHFVERQREPGSMTEYAAKRVLDGHA